MAVLLAETKCASRTRVRDTTLGRYDHVSAASIRDAPGGATTAADCQVELADAFGVGEQEDLDALPSRMAKANTTRSAAVRADRRAGRR
jgi:hypothetical protein